MELGICPEDTQTQTSIGDNKAFVKGTPQCLPSLGEELSKGSQATVSKEDVGIGRRVLEHSDACEVGLGTFRASSV